MRVRVPGSSANLGPGFDCLGLAWQCYNEMEFIPGGDALVIEGCDERYRTPDNLAYRGWQEVLRRAGLAEPGLTLRFGRTEIPVSRGLGSSAALIAGGVAAANAVYALRLSDAELLAAATAVEGHPDNVAPSLFGGLSASAMDGERAVTARFAISGALHFTALIPDFELSTALARSVLPAQVSRQDAIFNLSRTALLLGALQSGDTSLLACALDDRLHQPFRTPLIAHFETARALARRCGAAGFCISGAGSTLLCIAAEADFAPRMAAALARALPRWRALPLRPDTQGVQIL